MAQAPTLVRFGQKGSVWVASAGTSLPTSASGVGGSGPSGFTDLGLVDDAGVTISKAVTTTSLKGWGAGIVRTSVTDTTNDFKFKLLETNADVLAIWFGADPAAVTGAKFSITVPAIATVEEFPAVIDWYEVLAGTTYQFRIVLPRVNVTAFDDISISDANATEYGVTFSALADSSGNAYYIYGDAADIDPGSSRLAAGFEL